MKMKMETCFLIWKQQQSLLTKKEKDYRDFARESY